MPAWPKPVRSTSGQKSATIKRPKPLGYEILFSPTSVSSTRLKTVRGYAGYNAGPFSGEYYPQAYIVPMYASPEVNYLRLYDDAKLKVLAGIKDQKVNLAQTLAEFGQVASMFQDSSTRVLRAVRAAKRLNVYGVLTALVGTDTTKYPKRWRDVAKQPTRSSAETLLAFNYGVKPLISDCEGMIDEFIQAYQTKPLIRRVSSGVSMSISDQETALFHTPYGSFLARHNPFIRVRVRVTAYVEFEKFSTSTVLGRLGFRNAPALAWELTPYSHVVDYFFSVGRYLQTLDALNGVKRYSATASTREEKGNMANFVPYKPIYGAPLIGSVSSTLQITSSRGALPLTISSVHWTPSINFERSLNLLAMARVGLRGIK